MNITIWHTICYISYFNPLKSPLVCKKIYMYMYYPSCHVWVESTWLYGCSPHLFWKIMRISSSCPHACLSANSCWRWSCLTLIVLKGDKHVELGTGEMSARFVCIFLLWALLLSIPRKLDPRKPWLYNWTLFHMDWTRVVSHMTYPSPISLFL